MAAPAYLELPSTGFEQGVTDIQRDILQLSRQFAADVMRPNGAILDRMTPEEVIGEGSLYWTTLLRYK